MSDPIALISSAQITEDELIAFLRDIGAVILTRDSFLGRLSDQNRHVWIAISNEELEIAENLVDYKQLLTNGAS